MDKFISVVQVVLPIFCTVFLGIFARKKNMFSSGEIQAFQRFVIKFCVPCLLFQSCLTAEVGAEALSALMLPIVLLILAVFGFRVGKKWFPYHNIPFAFCCKETGMLGIPLYMTLFGATQAYRLGVLDLGQQLVAIPTLAILAASAGTNPTLREIVRKVLSSPFLLMSVAGLTLNLSGAADAMAQVGVLDVITEVTGFIAQPVSAVMLFSVGFNFAVSEGNKDAIRRISIIHLVLFALAGLVMQAVLLLVPGVVAEMRWAVLMYTTLPASYLASSMGRTEDEAAIASGVCSLLTVVSLVVFCVAAFFVA